RLLHLRVVAKQAGRPAARLLAASQLDQRIDAGAGDAGNYGAVVRADPAHRRQLVGGTRPAVPLVVERCAGMHHRAPLRQEHVVDGPVEAAGAAQPGDVPAAGHDLALGTLEDGAPIAAGPVGPGDRLAIFDDLETAKHPHRLVATAAELPAAGDAIAALDRHRLAAALHRSTREGDTAVAVNLLGALLRQAEHDQLADRIICDVPADRAATFGEQLPAPQLSHGIGPEAAVGARDQQAVETGLPQLFEQGARETLLAFELDGVIAQLWLQCCCGLDDRLRVEIGGQAALRLYRIHRLLTSVPAAPQSR